jgi:hypothetical protein
MPRPLYPRERPDTHIQETGWVPGPVWTDAENLAPTGIRSPDSPARSQSLYRLSFPAHINKYIISSACEDVRTSFPITYSSRNDLVARHHVEQVTAGDQLHSLKEDGTRFKEWL